MMLDDHNQVMSMTLAHFSSSIATILDFLVDKRSWEIIEKIPLYDVGLLI